MAGGNVKGICIEFRGDTTKLDKALRQVNQETRDIDKELRQVENALKFNPTNVDLWRQKQQLLTDKVRETKDKLDLLKQAQSQMDASGVDKNSQEYRELQREIIETESKAKHFEGELQKIGNAKLQALSAQVKEVGDKMKNVGSSMTTKVTAPIVAGYTVAAKYASDYEENLNKIDVAFGANSKAVKDWANNARKEFGLSKVQATDAVSAFGALGKGIGLSEKDAAKMSTTLAGLSADLGSYFNVGTDESSKALEGIFTGESEALKKFGVVMTDTNLQKFAEDNGKVWKEMSESDKVALRYQYVLSKTKDAQGDFARTSDGTANSMKIFKSAVQDLATGIGTNLIPIITPVIQKITAIVEKFGELSPAAQKVITIIGVIVAAIGPLLVVIGTLASGIGSIISLAPMLGGAFTALMGPIGIAIGIIAALIAIGVLLYKNWDKIKAAASALKNWIVTTFNSLKTKVSEIFGKIKDAMLKPIEKAKELIKGIIEKIKGFFNFKAKLPHIKLPHFVIRPKGWHLSDLLEGVIPSLGIDWYAKGGIFNSPRVIGVGEAGPEAVVPIDKLQNMIMASNAQMISALVTAIQAANMNGASGGEYVIQVNLGGANVATEIFKLNKQGKLIMEA